MRSPRVRPTFNRTYAVAAYDVFMAALAFVLALVLRRGADTFWEESISFILEGALLFTFVAAIVFWRMRIYRGVWRYIALRDVVIIVQAVSLAVMIFLPLLFALNRLEYYPRSALFINWYVLIALLLGPRIIYRMILDGSVGGVFQRGVNSVSGRIPVLLLGVGDNTALFIGATTRGSSSDYRVVGILDDDPSKVGGQIRGIRIYGTVAQLPEVIERLRRQGTEPQRVVLTAEDSDPNHLRDLLARCEAVNLPLSRLPQLTDVHDGNSRAMEVRPIRLEDLLGRSQTVLAQSEMKLLIQDKRVCVTGAGGTIGAELVRQIAECEPAHLTLIDNAEYNLYCVDLELFEEYPHLSRSTILGDVRDRGRLDSAFRRERPELVLHAAALKHVHMVEANPNEGVLTNAIGTRNVADACVAIGARVLVLISTDKAVNPTSVMGATKRVAESYCQALAESDVAEGLRVVTVRFGNVLGSSGSVVPLFRRQIAAGGPVTVTHPEVTRYFMTTREAVQLVLQASTIGAKEAGAQIFVLDMGKPIKILDLARQMIRLAGFIPDKDINIEFTGLRAGEKQDEILFHAAEPLGSTDIPGILRAETRSSDITIIRNQLDQLYSAAHNRRTDETMELITSMVPEYRLSADVRPNTIDRVGAV